MANMHKNIFIRWLKEEAGEQVGSYRTGSGKMIPVSHPMLDDHRQLTRAAKTDPAALREAATYASFAGLQKAYTNREKKTDVAAYLHAVADWFCGPKVLEIDIDGWTGRQGQVIRVKAKDNVGVSRLTVEIRDADGNLLESGEAEHLSAGSSWWRYTTQSRIDTKPCFPCIEATAWDLPGNCDSFVIN